MSSDQRRLGQGEADGEDQRGCGHQGMLRRHLFLATVHRYPACPRSRREQQERTPRGPVQEQLKEPKFPPPENGRQGGIVDWYKRDGELRVELMCVEEDGMSGRKKAKTSKLPRSDCVTLLTRTKPADSEKVFKDEWLPMAGKARWYTCPSLSSSQRLVLVPLARAPEGRVEG